MTNPPQPRRAAAVISILLALPVVAIALWIALVEGETIYAFLVSFGGRQGEDAWRVIERCRIAARLLLPVAIVQIGAGAAILWSLLRPTGRGRRLLIAVLWLGMILAVSLEAYWLPRMMGTVTARAGMSAQRSDDMPTTKND